MSKVSLVLEFKNQEELTAYLSGNPLPAKAPARRGSKAKPAAAEVQAPVQPAAPVAAEVGPAQPAPVAEVAQPVATGPVMDEQAYLGEVRVLLNRTCGDDTNPHPERATRQAHILNVAKQHGATGGLGTVPGEQRAALLSALQVWEQTLTQPAAPSQAAPSII